jgi:hypothetical protein
MGKGRGGRRKGGERGGITRARHWSKRLSMAVRFRKRPMGLMMSAIDYICAVGRRSRPLPAPVPAETDNTNIHCTRNEIQESLIHFPTISVEDILYCYRLIPSSGREGVGAYKHRPLL